MSTLDMLYNSVQEECNKQPFKTQTSWFLSVNQNLHFLALRSLTSTCMTHSRLISSHSHTISDACFSNGHSEG
jgi:hypothetical protein